jgi:hypothetical protein
MRKIESGMICFHSTSIGKLKLNDNIRFYENCIFPKKHSSKNQEWDGLTGGTFWGKWFTISYSTTLSLQRTGRMEISGSFSF